MTSDRCVAAISDVVSNATVAPPAFSSATAAATALSIDVSNGIQLVESLCQRTQTVVVEGEDPRVRPPRFGKHRRGERDREPD